MLRLSRSSAAELILIHWLLFTPWITAQYSQHKSLAAGVQQVNDSVPTLDYKDDDLSLDSLEFDEDEDPFFRDEDSPAAEDDDDEYDPDLDAEEEDRQQPEQNVGLLPRLYGMLRNTFSFGRTESKKENTEAGAEFYDDDEKGDEVLDINDFDQTSDEKKFLASDGRGLFDPPLNYTDDFDGDQGRQFFPMPMYMLQGIYLVEPRLNHYIDGVLRNLGSEIKISGIDPLYYRVLPRGRVASRVSPANKGIRGGGIRGGKRRRKPGNRNRRRRNRNRNRRRRRRRPFFGRQLFGGKRRRRNPGKNRNRRKGPAGKRGKAKAGQNRIAGQNVGLGRVDGLSNLSRDGPTEMQSQTADGNYTLVRSHFTMGPLDLTMQFRTVRGIKRAATTMHKLRIHTVTRVSNDGSEMMDFFLDRPHPETIKVRGKLFPMAERVARNIFSRLFANDSFLVARIREKTSMSLLSKPAGAQPTYNG